MLYVDSVPPEEATGDLKRAYDLILKARGVVPEIRRCQSLEPLVVEGNTAFYPGNNYRCQSIDRRFSEMIATVVSVANQCRFGGRAHADLLADATGDRTFADAILADYTTVDLPLTERVALDYARKLTLAPHESCEADIQALRDAGWTDQQIVAIVHVTAFFAYWNRVADALNVTQS